MTERRSLVTERVCWITLGAGEATICCLDFEKAWIGLLLAAPLIVGLVIFLPPFGRRWGEGGLSRR